MSSYFIAEVTSPAGSALPLTARTIQSLFRKCQRAYGVCIGRLVNYDEPNPSWRFARCNGKFSSCATTITDVTVYHSHHGRS